MQPYKGALKHLERDIERCSTWLAKIRALSVLTGRLFRRYQEELAKLGYSLNVENVLQNKRNAEKVEANAMRCIFILEELQKATRNIAKVGEVDEKLVFAAEEDSEKVTKGIKYITDTATVFTIYKDLRAAFVELKKLIELTWQISGLLSAEIGRLNEIRKITKIAATKGYKEELAAKAREHFEEEYAWIGEKRRKGELTRKDEEELKKKTGKKLNVAVKLFRSVMEMGEELLNAEKKEFEEIKKISVIESSLHAAERQLVQAVKETA